MFPTLFSYRSFAPPTAIHLDNHQPFHCVPRFPVVGVLQIVGRMTKDPHLMKFSDAGRACGLRALERSEKRKQEGMPLTASAGKEKSYIRSIYYRHFFFRQNRSNHSVLRTKLAISPISNLA